MMQSGLGYDAIQAAVRLAYPDGRARPIPTDFAPPFEHVLAVRVEDHWVLITLGLTQLDGEPQGQDLSGWGQEITLRVQADAEDAPPGWAIDLLGELVEGVTRARSGWAHEDAVDVENGIGDIGGALLLDDPDLPAQQTALGAFAFIRAVGIPESALQDDPSELADAIKARNRALVTAPAAQESLPSPRPHVPPADDSSPEVVHVWAALETAMDEALAGLSERLWGPSTASALNAAEQVMGRSLPDDVRASYLCHDGERIDATTGLLGRESLLRLDDVVATWQRENAFERLEEEIVAHGPVKADLWNAAWLPIAGTAGCMFCIDLDPAPGGSVGQVIYVSDRDDRVFEARSWTAFLKQRIDAMASGALVYDAGQNRLVERALPSSGLELDI